MKKYLWGIVLTLGSAILLFLNIFFFTGCNLTPPKKDDFKIEYTYEKAFCDYLNQENPDKSSCIGYFEIIKEKEKEQRYIDRLKFCLDSENRPERWDFEKCVLFINQK